MMILFNKKHFYLFFQKKIILTLILLLTILNILHPQEVSAQGNPFSVTNVPADEFEFEVTAPVVADDIEENISVTATTQNLIDLAISTLEANGSLTADEVIAAREAIVQDPNVQEQFAEFFVQELIEAGGTYDGFTVTVPTGFEFSDELINRLVTQLVALLNTRLLANDLILSDEDINLLITTLIENFSVSAISLRLPAVDIAFSVSPCFREPNRRINGECNNLVNRAWGKVDIPLLRKTPSAYGDSLNTPSGAVHISARYISNLVCAPPQTFLSREQLSALTFTWGQFIDHDIGVSPTPEGEEAEHLPIAVPADDPIFTQDSLSFTRSRKFGDTGENDIPREQFNHLTAWIDGSSVYGSTVARANYLRDFNTLGKLKTSTGNFLPYNTVDNEVGGEIDPTTPNMAGAAPFLPPAFVAGDFRANEQTGLTAMHTLFVREHNRICDSLINSGLTDGEYIYQHAKRWVSGIIQSITYNEFLPALGIPLEPYVGYNDSITPDMSNVFSTAAYRLGHSMITPTVFFLNDSCNYVGQGEFGLREVFFRPPVVAENGIGPILKGLSVQVQNEIDPYIIEDVRSLLFGNTPSEGGATDLAALNIQRGRDHGLANYITYRRLFNMDEMLPSYTFADISSDPVIQQALQTAYEDSVNYIDPWVGFLAEDHLPDAAVGKTLHNILKEQFQRMRDGDFYHYENDPELSAEEVHTIKHTTLSQVIKRNTSISNIQKYAFIAEPCIKGEITDASCGEENGDINVSIIGLRGELTYQWSHDPTATEANIWNLGAGEYTVTVTANNGLTFSKTFIITEINSIEITVKELTHPTCGENNGNILLEILDQDGEPVTDSLTYQWSHDPTAIGDSIGNVGAGDYTVTVTNQYDCIVEKTIQLEDDSSNCNEAPIAVNDSITTSINQTISIAVLDNDSDPEGDTFIIENFEQGANGTVTEVDNELIYTPNPDFVGSDTFSYTICDDQGGCADATVIIEVEECQKTLPEYCTQPQTPLTFCASFCLLNSYSITSLSTESNSRLTIQNNNCIKYRARKKFTGMDMVKITACEGANCETVYVKIMVHDDVDCENQAPQANDDFITVTSGRRQNVRVLDNDTDSDGDKLTITSFTQGTYGSVRLSTNGKRLIYTSDAPYVGEDQFSYQICDPFDACVEAIVFVTVEESNKEICDTTQHCVKPHRFQKICPQFCPATAEETYLLTEISKAQNGWVWKDKNGCFYYLAKSTGSELLSVEGQHTINNTTTTKYIFIEAKSYCGDSDKTANNLPSYLNQLTISSLYPNPVENNLQVNCLIPLETEQIQVRTFDLTGKTFIQQSMAVQPGDYQFNLNTKSYPSGLYFLEITTPTATNTVKFVKH